jgi:hypothetical protein
MREKLQLKLQLSKKEISYVLHNVSNLTRFSKRFSLLILQLNFDEGIRLLIISKINYK